jgi:hypothetical protein
LSTTACARLLTPIAAQFITSCPSSNPSLPVKSLPGLTLTPAAPAPGATVSVVASGEQPSGQVYVAWFTGLQVCVHLLGSRLVLTRAPRVQVLFTDLNGNSTVVPSSLANAGTVYAALVSSNAGAPTDDQLLSGLAVVPFNFKASASQ